MDTLNQHYIIGESLFWVTLLKWWRNVRTFSDYESNVVAYFNKRNDVFAIFVHQLSI